LSTVSDISAHDLSDFCEDDLDDYLEDPPTFNVSSEQLLDGNRGDHLNKLYGGILGSQQWSFGKPPSVDYDLGEWSKTSTMILADPPKKKYLLDDVNKPSVHEQEPKKETKVVVVVDPAEEHAKAVLDEKAPAADMSKAPAHAISFAQHDFFSRQEKMMHAFGGNGTGEQREPFSKRYRVLLIGMAALLAVLVIVLIVLGATGYLSSNKPEIKQAPAADGHKSMAMEAGAGVDVPWSTAAAENNPTWSLVDPATQGPDGPLAPSIEPRDPGVEEEQQDDGGASFQFDLSNLPPVSLPRSVSVSFTLSGEGEGTYYSPGVGLGACGAQHSDTQLVAALNVAQFGGYVNPTDSPACGACIVISGPKGSCKVTIVDKCPGCQHGDLDLSPAAFGEIADMAAGRVKISWAPC
jgi:hypothetical protein